MFARTSSKKMAAIVAASVVYQTSSSSVLNESKRNFYEDEPSLNSAPVSDPASPLPSQKIVNGVLVESPSFLEAGIKTVRESVYNVYAGATGLVDDGYSKYHQAEQKVTSTVSQLHDKSEDLLPNSAYIAIAFLSGTILARQRSVFAKVVYPVILGVGSFRYFLPQTFGSTTGLLWQWEQQKLPEVAKQQESLVKKSEQIVTQLEKTTESSQAKVTSMVDSLRLTIKKYTGLNLDDDATKK
ncbi:hypothetical protein PSN45_003127 [Yamadazyma tenuis]|uniref:MICOS complex subunit n=1 Tax=Candida tenuis (strain ATCC 10573 / BCRC 21748 / CBS 615 / JCM 9827 / NBRC 10315 / NRRL Y-1498 / VKM Y-70) TaxID=590646 RepID=G3AZB2_CANTC|nr:uncharacterized protein CANTEDRAFT_112914 [Yamadazyma tenuis ATCC 10573]XP_006684629.1 uncharacterized protein CANTEDRAFT_112914 [Yamadazyma tenuis ATCC 10573]EGV66054.1 hypothetical protein CANTEDRAFT_112914 [Yamadazyma tenuis ATCC 10573]EGV66055.1 hypothetical protein CANTEDRAFT_112914 [Yamadazyma tenuis ATCC 10573]WEJ95604.1 hypothetical protein PSN45_003127 [Yamadazyma tenuis]